METINALPPILVSAISEQLEYGYLGPNAVRRDLYQHYALHVENVNQFGRANSQQGTWREVPIEPIEERLPPAGWTDDDVIEARNKRLEREMDERSGQ